MSKPPFIFILFFFIISSFNLAFGQTDYLQKIDYNIKIASDKHLVINAKFYGNFSQKFVVNLPYKFGPASYNSTIRNIHAVTKALSITHNKEGVNQVILHLPRSLKLVELEYDVYPIKDHKDFDIHDLIFKDDLIHAIGHAIFATPENISDADKLNAHIKWENLPKKWKVLSSHSRGNSLNFTSTIHDILDAVYVAGKVREYKTLVNNKSVNFSLYGSFDFDDSQIVDNSLKIIEAQRSFFKDYDFNNYLVSIIENPDGNSKMAIAGGTGLYNSFVMHVSKGTPFERYKLIFAHEHCHNWIGVKIRNSEEALNYWWSEGFTDYYSRVLSLRYGALQLSEFTLELETIINNYYNSTAVSLTNEDIAKGFWSNYDVQRLPYLRGFIFALYLNCKAKLYTESDLTDSILLDFYANSSQRFSNKNFVNLLNKYGSDRLNAKKCFSDYIEKGYTIPLDECSCLLPIKKAVLYDSNKIKKDFYYLPKKLDKTEMDQIIKFFSPIRSE